jgi:signal transduction histidine kinase
MRELTPPPLDAAGQAWSQAPVGMAWIDMKDGRLLEANASFRLMIGQETLPTLGELLAGEDAEVWTALHARRAWTARLPFGGRPCEWVIEWPAAGPQALLSVWPLRQPEVDAASLSAQLGHELRTPLAGVISLHELLLGSELADRQRKLLEMAQQSAHQLLQLINHTLDLARLDAGAVQLAPRPFALHDCLRDAMQPLLAQAHGKGVLLQARVQPGLPHRLRADDLRLRQILSNLVGNALKFTETGEVRVEVRRAALSGSGVRLAVSVTDTGVGMSAEQCRRLFRPFAQAEASTQQRHGGSGLGLVIVQRLVRLMGGGAVQVESAPGLGSSFRFEVEADVER